MKLESTVRVGEAALDPIRSAGPLLQRIGAGEALSGTTARSLLVAGAGAALFGLALGSYAGRLPQALAATLKLPILLLGTAFICFPTFHIFQTWRAPRPLDLGRSIALQASTLATVALIWASLAPPVLFLIHSTQDYRLAQLLAVAVGATGGLVGLRRLLAGYSTLCLEAGRGPRLFLFVYFVAFALVGSQLAWEMRPFVGSPSLPFELFRDAGPRGGNIFTAALGLGG